VVRTHRDGCWFQLNLNHYLLKQVNATEPPSACFLNLVPITRRRIRTESYTCCVRYSQKW